MKKSLLILLCVISLHAENIYQKVFQENYSTLIWQEEEWPNESFSEYMKRCYDYQSHMQEIKKRKTTAFIFDAVSLEHRDTVLYDAITGRDINLLAGSKIQDPYVAQLVDRTDTIWGKMALYGMLNNPTDDVQLLMMRQKIVKELLHNDMLYAALKNDIFIPLSATDNLMLSFWVQDGFLQASKRCYYVIPFLKSLEEYLNVSPTALAFKSLCGHQTRFLSASLGLFATIGLPVYLISRALHTQLPDYANQLCYRFQGEGGPILSVLSCADNQMISNMGIAATTIYLATTTKESFEWAFDCVTLEDFLHKKLCAVARFFKIVQRLMIILKENPDFVAACPEAQNLQKEVKRIMERTQMKKVIKLLFSKTFAQEGSTLAHRGRVLVAYGMMHSFKKECRALLLNLGNLETAVSCATLYKEFEHERVHYCFPDYQKASEPRIMFKDFWNPLIAADVVVPNSLVLGGSERRNMIITGPNAGGKSSLIKAMVINIILAQSIGLAAAHEMCFTPFYKVATYLNIVDDIAQGNSLFKAQVLRAQEMVFLAEHTPPDLFNFIALDEMFNGTSAQESSAAAYSVAHYLAQFKNSMCILATHHPQMTILERESDCYANYKVSVKLDEQGIKYPFTIEPGISHQHIALDILQQEGFDSVIIKQARELLNQLS